MEHKQIGSRGTRSLLEGSHIIQVLEVVVLLVVETAVLSVDH